MGYRYHWDAKAVGLMLAAVGVCSVIVQGVLVGKIVKFLGERRTILTGLACGVIGFTIQGMAPTGTIYAAGVVAMSLWGMMNPALQGVMTRLVSPNEQGQLQGANSSVLGIAALIGPLLFTQLFANAISAHRDWQLPGAAFLMSATLLVAAAIMMLRLMTTRLKEMPPAGHASVPASVSTNPAD
jgi:DHA1 family tetracycline resistance protein-like MFS transporter